MGAFRKESRPAEKEKLANEDKKQVLKPDNKPETKQEIKKPEAKKLEEKAKVKPEEKKDKETTSLDAGEPDFSEFVPQLRKEERKPRIELTPSNLRVRDASELESFVSSAPAIRETRREDRKSNYNTIKESYGNPNEMDIKYASSREDSRAIDDVGRLREFIQRKPGITADQPLRQERQYRELNMPRSEMNTRNSMQESFKSSYELDRWQAPENPFLGKREELKKYNTRKR